MLKAAIVGATGVVGQQFVLALQDHPWFTIEGLAGSQRSAGQSYGQALRDPKSGAMRWYDQTAPNTAVLDLP
ncbi:aspartate-semialdehyde dehydrogenase, partial [Candidatus Entotheonella serta]